MDPIVVDHLGANHLGERRRHFDHERVVLGSDEGCGLRFDRDREPQVSGRHAELERRGDQLVLRDLGSANGSYLAGTKIDGDTAVAPDQEIRLGPGGPKLRARIGEPPSHGTMQVEAPAVLPASGQQPKVGIGAETMRSAVEGAAQRERKRMTTILAVVALPLLALAGGAAWLASDSRDSAEELRAELAERAAHSLELMGTIGELTIELQGIQQDGELDAAERERRSSATETELARLRDQLAETQAALAASGGEEDWAGTAARFGDAIFLCVAVDPTTKRTGIGTAFCIGDDGLLATNAHVAEMLQGHELRWVIQNATGRVAKLRNIIAHPDFDSPNSPDIGLLRIELDGLDAPPPAMPIAATEAAHELAVGTHVGTLGFPGELQRNYLAHIDQATKRFEGVAATFKDGWIGRLTTYRGTIGDAADRHLVQHSASLSGGTSGSPMFLADGTVVGVSNSSVSASLTTTSGTGPAMLSAAEIGFAIRADELRAFANGIPWARDNLP